MVYEEMECQEMMTCRIHEILVNRVRGMITQSQTYAGQTGPGALFVGIAVISCRHLCPRTKEWTYPQSEGFPPHMSLNRFASYLQIARYIFSQMPRAMLRYA